MDVDDPSLAALRNATNTKKAKKVVDTKASKGRKLRYIRESGFELRLIAFALWRTDIMFTKNCKTLWFRYRTELGANSRPNSSSLRSLVEGQLLQMRTKLRLHSQKQISVVLEFSVDSAYTSHSIYYPALHDPFIISCL